MHNKVFLKIAGIIVFIVLAYILFITLFISPKISQYLFEAEAKEAKTQLDRVSAIISTKEKALKTFKTIRVDNHKKDIKNISHIAYAIMEANHGLYLKGKLTKAEAISVSLNAISKIEYGFKDDYIYVLDKKGNLALHPDKRFRGKNIYYYPDANGRLFVPDLIEKTLKNKSSYNRYSWSKLNSLFVSEKITFSIYFEPFDLIISSGVYIENIRQELESEKSKILDDLYPLINSIVLGKHGYIFLINNNDKMVLHPNKKLVGKDMSLYKQPNSHKYMVDELKDAYLDNRQWRYKWNLPNDKQNYIYEKISWVDYNKFFEWYMVSSVYVKDLETKSEEINKIILQISIILLLFLLLIAMFFIKKLLKPISVISKNMNLVKSGHLEIRNNIHTDDEFGELSEHFDEMIDSIEEHTKELEKKVEQRTAQIKHKLYTDELTGLKNREALLSDLKKENITAFILIDIEDFDDINELYGFSVGNEVLIEVSKLLTIFAKNNSVDLYRLDTDVFGILDKDMHRFVLYEHFLEEIQEVFKNEIYINSLDINIFIGALTGVSIAQDNPLKSANIALKNAKKSGLRYLVYNEEIDTEENIKKTMYWREKIKEALENDKVIPFFQAILNRDGKIIKYEALMRISEEIDGKVNYVSPGAFFDVAVKTKQYFKLNQMVIRKVFKNIMQIEEDVSINIGFSDVSNLDFNEFMDKEINKLSKTQREKIVFEILESDYISDYAILDKFIFKYRKKGIRIAIDDFGTGFSNFSHILKVKPDYIKIDGSLIKDINSDEKSYQMVKSIAQFSKSLGITVIAEFIHSKEVYEIVKDLEIDEFQGFYLGEPKVLIK